jgi:hypothetical protein
MCDGLEAEIASLAKKGVKFSKIQEARWGSITQMRLPGGSQVGLAKASDGTGPRLEMKSFRQNAPQPTPNDTNATTSFASLFLSVERHRIDGPGLHRSDWRLHQTGTYRATLY